MSFGGLKQVTNARRANAYKHLDKVRAADMKERDARLSGDGSGQVCLTDAGRAGQKDAFGDLGSQCGIFLGVLKEVDDFEKLLLSLFDSGHVVKGDFRSALANAFCFASAKAEGLIANPFEPAVRRENR